MTAGEALSESVKWKEGDEDKGAVFQLQDQICLRLKATANRTEIGE